MTFNRNEYYRRKYAEDAEFREKVKENIRRYAKTPLGIKTRAKNKEVFYGKNKDYNANYSRRYRDTARIKGICLRCFVLPIVKGYTLCQGCRVKEAERRKK